ncbi:Uncharacterized protein APZ42_031153 [Daphnia magna]|uniref:Uncharacterized protein n=1 Tax=Daphnia magna TaxID=35525 RepID=A0A164N375_9CRUS|nr:Uncharacterized protein APZ42_031153 [Daphnia magna]
MATKEVDVATRLSQESWLQHCAHSMAPTTKTTQPKKSRQTRKMRKKRMTSTPSTVAEDPTAGARPRLRLRTSSGGRRSAWALCWLSPRHELLRCAFSCPASH